MSKWATMIYVLLVWTGCEALPPPGKSTVESTVVTNLGNQVHQMNRTSTVLRRSPSKAFPRKRVQKTILSTNRNAIYVAVDNQVQDLFKKEADEYFNNRLETPRLEEVSWWIYAPLMKSLYDEVLVIPYDKFYKESLLEALDLMESRNKPYDLFLMTHGIHNHITTSKGYDLFSFRDLAELEGKLENLELVYNQACFGSTLSEDWLKAGADYVMSYPNFNRNFFYLEFFLKQYKAHLKDPYEAYEKANETFFEDLAKDGRYQIVLQMMRLSMEDYRAMTEFAEFWEY